MFAKAKTVCAWEFTVTFDLALLTKYTGQHSLRLTSEAGRVRRGGGLRHVDYSNGLTALKLPSFCTISNKWLGIFPHFSDSVMSITVIQEIRNQKMQVEAFKQPSGDTKPRDRHSLTALRQFHTASFCLPLFFSLRFVLIQ